MNRKQPKRSSLQPKFNGKVLFVELWDDKKRKSFLPIRTRVGETVLDIQFLLERTLSEIRALKRTYRVIPRISLYFLKDYEPSFEYRVDARKTDASFIIVRFNGVYKTGLEIRRAPNGDIIADQHNLAKFLRLNEGDVAENQELRRRFLTKAK